MKYIFILICVCLNYYVQAQKGHKKISTRTVKESITIYDLISELPVGCKVYSFDLSATGEKGLRSQVVPSDTLRKTLKELLPDPKKGNKIRVQILTSSCYKNKIVEFLFVIDETNKG